MTGQLPGWDFQRAVHAHRSWDATRHVREFENGATLASVGNWKRVAGVGYFFLLIGAASVAALVYPATDTGQRFIHALVAIMIVGVAAVAVLFPVMFFLVRRESRERSRR